MDRDLARLVVGVIPLIVLALPVEYAVPPTIIGVMNWPEPPHGILIARSTAVAKSEALTGWPLENFRPLRSVAV